MNVLAFVPARSGSKGIPKKNIKKLAGQPLIKYTISLAKKSKFVDKIFVSTDDKEIAKIAKSAGAEVPFLRPKKLATVHSLIVDALKHSLEYLYEKESYVPDIIVLLQPTSPLRPIKMIDDSVRLLKNSNSTSVLSVSKITKHPYNSFWYDGKYLKPFRKDFKKFSLRQKLPSMYHPTGAVYTFWTKNLKKYDSIYGEKIKPMIVDKEEFNIDIDEIFDFFVTEMMIKYWPKYRKQKLI